MLVGLTTCCCCMCCGCWLGDVCVCTNDDNDVRNVVLTDEFDGFCDATLAVEVEVEVEVGFSDDVHSGCVVRRWWC